MVCVLPTRSIATLLQQCFVNQKMQFTIGTVKKYSTIGISYKTYWTLYQLGYGR